MFFISHANLQVGLAACQIAKAIGLRVVGTAGHTRGLAIVRDVGNADYVFNHNDPAYIDEIKVPFCISIFLMRNNFLFTQRNMETLYKTSNTNTKGVHCI